MKTALLLFARRQVRTHGRQISGGLFQQGAEICVLFRRQPQGGWSLILDAQDVQQGIKGDVYLLQRLVDWLLQMLLTPYPLPCALASFDRPA